MDIIMSWQDDLEVCTLISEPSSMGFKSQPSYKLSAQCFAGRAIHQCVCRPSD